MLENLRFKPAETSKDDAERGAFARRLAAPRATSTSATASARCTASTPRVYDLPLLLPHAAGDLVATEVAC